MMSPRRVSVLSWLFTLLIGVLLIGCDQQAPVGSDAPKASDPSPVPTTLSSQVQDSIQTDRLSDLGLPTDLSRGVYSTKNVSVPDSLKNSVQSRAPSGFKIPNTRPNVSLQESNIGDDAKPSQNTRQNAADADTVGFTSTVEKDSPVPVVEYTNAPNSGSWSYYGGSYINIGYYYTGMGSYTGATKNISYIDVIGTSYVDFFPVFSGYDYGFDASFAGVWTSVDTESDTWYYQDGNHYVYDEGDQYPDGYYYDQFGTGAFEYNF